MANTLQLKNDIKKIKAALASKGLSATFKNKLKVKLQKAESDLKNSTPKGAKATLTSLKEQVKKKGYGVYKGAGVDLKKDAGEPALPIGRRESKGLKANQYGTKKGNKGNVYYEYRANRLDVKQPSKTAKYPKLSEGGEVDKYVEVNGTFYQKGTPQGVIDALEKARNNKTRVKIYSGDTQTGRDYYEQFDTTGTIGRSTGSIKIPLLIPTSRSSGGGAIMTKNILKIKDTKTGVVLYQASNYKQPNIEIVDSTMEGYSHELIIDGDVYSRHKTKRGAELLKSKLMADGGMMAHGGENTTELQKYLEVASERAFAGGGNGVNITDYGLSEAAGTIDMYHDVYTSETKNIFKKLVDSMVKDEIKNNQVGANDYKKGGMMAKGGFTNKEAYELVKNKVKGGIWEQNALNILRNDAMTKPDQMFKPTGDIKLLEKYMKKGGMMADGGKLSKKDFFKKYEENEDENMHTENVVLLAENYGTESDIRDAKTILAKHESIGHLPTSLRLERDALHDKLYAKYVQSREDGGMMAESVKTYSTDMKPDFTGRTFYTVKSDIGIKEFTTDKEFHDYIHKLENQGYKRMSKGGYMADGGVTEKEVVDSNAQMVLSNVKEVKHHAEELAQIVTKKSNIEAWVVAKIERASTDLSDVTHYLEGQHDKMSMGGSVYNHLHKMDKK